MVGTVKLRIIIWLCLNKFMRLKLFSGVLTKMRLNFIGSGSVMNMLTAIKELHWDVKGIFFGGGAFTCWLGLGMSGKVWVLKEGIVG